MTAAVYRFSIGSIACTVLLDGASHLGSAGILRRYPDATEAEFRQAFADLGRSLDDADSSFNLLLIETAGECILVDAGEGGKPKGGAVIASLHEMGRSPEDISLIVLTHTHRDHVLGLLDHAGQPVFTNARCVISRDEMRYWRGRVAAGEVDDAAILALVDAQGVRQIAMDAEIVPGVHALALPGHTPGQIGLRVEAGGQTLLHLADALHQPFQFAHPEWSPTFDLDTRRSVPTRLDALAFAADTGALTLFYHLTFPGLGRVRRAGDAFSWEAWQ